MGRFSVTVADETIKGNGEPETASYGFETIALTAGNVAAQLGLSLALESAFATITIGNALKHTLTYLDQTEGTGPASDPLAQRENKWLCRYHDAVTNEKLRISVPCADLTKKMVHSEFVDLTVDPGLSLKTAFDAVVRNPQIPANAGVLDSVQFVGRNT